MRIGFRCSYGYSARMRFSRVNLAIVDWGIWHFWQPVRYVALGLACFALASPIQASGTPFRPLVAVTSTVNWGPLRSADGGASANWAEWFASAICWRTAAKSSGGGFEGSAEDLAKELDEAGQLAAKLNARPPALTLAGAVTGEGHWTFMNSAGIRFTAANKQELERVYRSLAPEIVGRPAPVIIFVTASSVFRHAEHLALLPRDAQLKMAMATGAFALRRFGEDAASPWFAEVRPNVFVRAGEAAVFDETVAQLAREVGPDGLRVLGLEPGGPVSLRPHAAQRQGATGAEAIDPVHLAAALGTLRGQTAVITGRLKGGRVDGGDELIYRTSTGPEKTLDLGPVRAAAAAADVNLLMVNATAPRQPGARNWLWLSVEVDGLADALRQRTLGDFLVALSGAGRPVFVTGRQGAGGERFLLRVIPTRAGMMEAEPGLFAEVVSELVAEVAGSVVPHAVDADLVSMARQRELDRRLLWWVPSAWQYGFALALLAGLLGLPVALGWWRMIWPEEVRADYADEFGFYAARLVRLALFVLLFLPVVGLPAIVWGMIGGLKRLTGIGARREGADASAINR